MLHVILVAVNTATDVTKLHLRTILVIENLQ